MRLTTRTLICATLTLELVVAPACGLRQFAAGHREPPELLAFVGRKIAVEQVALPPVVNGPDGILEGVTLDLAFEARYEVLQVVHGSYSEKQVSFRVFDHYGAPAFSKYDPVLLYLVRPPGEGWTHLKYLFSPVFDAPPHGWHGCGGELEDAVQRLRARGVSAVQGVQAVPVGFQPEAVIDLPEEWLPWLQTPSPHIEVRGDKAICKDGARPIDLFTVSGKGATRPAPSGSAGAW